MILINYQEMGLIELFKRSFSRSERCKLDLCDLFELIIISQTAHCRIKVCMKFLGLAWSRYVHYCDKETLKLPTNQTLDDIERSGQIKVIEFSTGCFS